jgi:hypothetical protein
MDRPVNYARVFNDAYNDLLDSGVRSYKARKLADEHAEVCAQLGRCTPKPIDWDAP